MAGRGKTDVGQPADKTPAPSKATDKPQPEKPQTEKPQTEKPQPEKPGAETVPSAGKTGAGEKDPGIMEAELLAKGSSATAGKVDVVDMSKSPVPWSGGAQLLWVGGRAGDRLTLRPLVSVPGRYALAGYFALGMEYCDFDVLVNGTAIGSVRASSGAPATRSDKIGVGNVELRFGENPITIQLQKGAAPRGKSAGCSVGVDGFELRPIK
jgi:hypothetical protein